MEVFGVKERTARGYGFVVAALRYIYDRKEEFFLRRGHSWNEFMEVVDQLMEFVFSAHCAERLWSMSMLSSYMCSDVLHLFNFRIVDFISLTF